MQSEMDNSVFYIPGIILVAFLVSLFSFPSFIKLLERKNLGDVPDHRKIHSQKIPNMGGAVIVISMMITVIFFFPIEQLLEYRFFIGGLLIMFIVGLRDDLVPLRPFLKMMSQVVPILIVIFFFDLKLESFYSLADIQFPLWFQIALTIFTMIIITNSFNLIDGVDGLSGTLSLLSIAAFSTVFYFSGNTFFAYLLMALGGAILGFLVFNWSPAKIFLGDNGALFIGFVLSCSAILFIRENAISSQVQYTGSVGTALAILAVPLYDMFRIIVLRLVNRRGLMQPDRNHIHHLLLECGITHGQVTMTLFSLQALLILTVLIGSGWSDWTIIIILGVAMLGFNGILTLICHRKAKTQKSGI